MKRVSTKAADVGTLARVGARLLEMSPASRCFACALITVAITGVALLYTISFLWRHGFVPLGWAQLGVNVFYLAFFFAIAIAAWFARRSSPDAPLLVRLFIGSYFVLAAITCCLYGYGADTNFFAAAGITGAVLGALLFEQRAVILGVLSYIAIVGVVSTAQALEVLPDAPLHNEITSADVPVSFVLSVVAMLLSFGAVRAWQQRDARVRELEQDLATAQRDRLLWLEKLAHVLRHELRNQLVGIHSSLSLARSAPEHQKRYLARADRSLEVMRKLLTRAADATDLEAFLSEERLVPLDLSALVREHVEALADDLAHRRITVDVTPGLWIEGSALRIIQLLDKLLTNAIEHSEPETAISVSLARDARMALLRVQNEGGALPEESDRIFEPFVSLGDRHPGENLGIGLYVVRRIAEQHGGVVSVRSGPDHRGAVFSLGLPTLEFGEPRSCEDTRGEAPRAADRTEGRARS